MEVPILRDYSTPTEELLPLFLSSGIGAQSVRLAELRVNLSIQSCVKGRLIMSQNVTVVDVTLRDGFQNEPNPVSTRDKLLLAEKLVKAGIKDIQATSFVHPRWVPQMADAEAVASGLANFPGITFSALVPNLKGYERAVAAGILHHEFVMAASDSFNRKNLNRTLPQPLELLH